MRRVIIVAYEGITTLDATGPAEVFAGVSEHVGGKPYRIELASVGGGLRGTTSMLQVQTRNLLRCRPQPSDLVIVAGGRAKAVRAAIADEKLRRWLLTADAVVERIASVCSGAFVLAAAGILDGKRAATHWAGCEQLAQLFPKVTVDANAIFVVDGRVWTSAGVTTGIDMALAMVEHDHGRGVADAIAAQLVLYLRRPGFQSQFSNALVSQLEQSEPLAQVMAWIRANLREANVETLAQGCALSVRTLHRRCREQLGITPGKLIDKLRVEHARTLLATTDVPAKVLAEDCGFGTATSMRRTFERELGVGPAAYRLLHAHA